MKQWGAQSQLIQHIDINDIDIGIGIDIDLCIHIVKYRYITYISYNSCTQVLGSLQKRGQKDFKRLRNREFSEIVCPRNVRSIYFLLVSHYMRKRKNHCHWKWGHHWKTVSAVLMKLTPHFRKLPHVVTAYLNWLIICQSQTPSHLWKWHTQI